MESVSHFEIPADDVKRASEFYKKNFGWNIQPYPGMDYTILHTTEIDKDRMPKKVGAINGGMMKRSEEISSPVITIVVKNMDESLKKVEATGGKVYIEKMPIEKMGFAAYIKDTEGNIIGLFEAKDM